MSRVNPTLRNHFDRLGIAISFEINTTELQRNYRRAQQQAHPDTVNDRTSEQAPIADAAGAQLLALQHSMALTEAYQTLLQPLRRAHYLCQLHGIDAQAAPVPFEQLEIQLEWREQLQTLAQALTLDMTTLLALQNTIDAAWQAAFERVRVCAQQAKWQDVWQELSHWQLIDKVRSEAAQLAYTD